MKKLFNFVGFSCLNVCLYLYNKVVYAQDRFMTVSKAQTLYGVSSPALGFGKMRFLITLIGVFSAFILSVFILFVISLAQKFKKFDYKSDYKKFKIEDKIKVTFVDENGKVITKRCRITAIDSEMIVFENKTNTYKCTPSDIKNIKKRSKTAFILKLVLFIGIFLFWVICLLVIGLLLYSVPDDEMWKN